jgi:hypothetical protein
VKPVGGKFLNGQQMQAVGPVLEAVVRTELFLYVCNLVKSFQDLRLSGGEYGGG